MTKQIVLLLALSITAVFGCRTEGATTNEKSVSLTTVVPGKWRVAAYDAHLAESTPEMLEHSRKLALSTVFVFTGNGKFERIDEYNPEATTGVWHYSDSSKELSITFLQNGREITETFEVAEWTNKEVNLKQDMNRLGSISMQLEKQR